MYPEHRELQEEQAQVFTAVCRGVAVAFAWRLQCLFKDCSITCALIPVIGMMIAQMTHQFVLAQKLLLTGEARPGQDLGDAGIIQKHRAVTSFSRLPDDADSIKSLVTHGCPVLKC